MVDPSPLAEKEGGPLPPDDTRRDLVLRTSTDHVTRSISVVGDTYSIIIRGEDTQGRYCLINMLIPDGSGPPLHRHDFEEMFSLLEGELEFYFRGETRSMKAPAYVNIPANAPHRFRNTSGTLVHMLCMCTPAGQDEFFAKVGIPVSGQMATASSVSETQLKQQQHLMIELAPEYRTEFLQE